MIAHLLTIVLAAGPASWGGASAVRRANVVFTGPIWPDSADDFVHVYFNGSALIDSKTVATWTAVGSAPPQYSAAMLCPASAAGFSGSHYYSGGNAFTPDGSFSVCAIINPGSSPGGAIAAKDNNGARAWMVDLNTTSLEFFVWKSGGGPTSVSVSAAVVASTAAMVCVVYEYVADGSSKVHAFAHGAYLADQNTTAVGPVVSNTTPVTIGARAWTGNESAFTGTIFEEKIVNKALSQAEIAQLYRLFVGSMSGTCQ